MDFGSWEVDQEEIDRINRRVKKVLLIILTIILVLIGPFIINVKYNDLMVYRMSRSLKKQELPENTTVIEQLSVCGNLFGNGDGMDYYSALLVESELTIEELKDFYDGKEIKSPVPFKKRKINIKVQEAEKEEYPRNAYMDYLDKTDDYTNLYVISVYYGGRALLDLRGR